VTKQWAGTSQTALGAQGDGGYTENVDGIVDIAVTLLLAGSSCTQSGHHQQ
jgi:hypothetical protein